MACRGVHFAIDKEQYEKLLSAKSDEELIEIIQEEIEEEWDEEWLHETDKAWDAIHRCLTDGKLEWNNGDFPLNAVIAGGKQLHQGVTTTLSHSSQPNKCQRLPMRYKASMREPLSVVTRKLAKQTMTAK